MSLSSMKRLADAVGTLAEPQGRIARRNARRRVADAIRHLEIEVRRAYPHVVVKKQARSTRDPEARRKALTAKGWVRLSEVDISYWRDRVSSCAVAGVRLTRLKTSNGSMQIWGPEWVLVVNPDDVASLKKMRKDVRYRKARQAEHLLKTNVQRPPDP